MPTPPLEVTAAQVRWFRLRRQGLVEPFASPERAAATLGGVQAQILTSAGLALGNRVAGLDWAGVFDCLSSRRTLVKLWGQRGTLHLYPADDWPTLIAAMSRQTTWWSRLASRDPAAGPTYKAAVAQLGDLLRARGTLTREAARAVLLDLPVFAFSSWGGIFADLVRGGVACHVPAAGTEGRFAHREHWLPALPWNPPDCDAANVEFARRYLRAYGPARSQDLAYWRGATVANAARWLARLGHEVLEVRVEGVAQLALREDAEALRDRPPSRAAWPVRLLGRFDPMLLSHKDKSWLIEPESQRRVWRPAGHIEATLLVAGRIAGTWRYDRTPGGIVVRVTPFAPLPQYVMKAIERRAGVVARFFGRPLADLVVANASGKARVRAGRRADETLLGPKPR